MYSAIQSLTLTFPGYWATLGNKHLGLSRETISLLDLCAVTQKYQTCKDTALSGYQFTLLLSGASEICFLCPEKFTFIGLTVGFEPGISRYEVEHATT